MKLLSISDGKGFFLSETGSPAPLDQLSKEDLLRLVELTLTSDAQMDAFDPALLQNQAHQIIYENVWSRLAELALRKKEFLDESRRLYLTEYERYRSDLPPQQDAPDQSASDAAPLPQTHHSATS
jgi:hypothetical protein